MAKKKSVAILLFILLVGISIVCLFLSMVMENSPFEQYYTAEDFDITTIKSQIDKNQNGIDDYTDILLGARQDAINKPKYKADSYVAGGYPPDNIGVCTDVVWRALKAAGYSLKEMVDEDIAQHIELYPAVNGKADPNIDFRRVRNLKVFFDRKLMIVTTDLSQISQFQPGDIVIFGNNYRHIGIISDRRNKEGIPYLIHNAGQTNREENTLKRWANGDSITGHYRFCLTEQE